MSNYTQEELDIQAQLGVISNAILNMPLPRSVSEQKAIAEARSYAARELTKLGYSTRQIMKALGLKSPQSVSVYLREKL